MITPPRPVDSASVARHYDEIDAIYRELWGEHLHHGLWETGREEPGEAVEALVERVAVAAGIGPGQRVCDVGCGYGATAGFLSERYRAEVVGVTISRRQIAVARARGSGDPALSFRLGDWLENDLPDGAFDAVVAIESPSHMGDKARFVAEAFRVLRPGGRLAVCAWLADERARPWQVRHLLEPICVEGRLPGLASAGEYAGWLEGAGFVDVAADDLSAEVRRTWDVCLARTARWALTRPRAWRYLLDPRNENRSFARAVVRIGLAYRAGCLRYGLFAARRPAAPRGATSTKHSL